MLIVFKCVFLFFAVWFTFVNFVKAIRGQAIGGLNFLIQAIGITGFIIIHFQFYV